MSARPVHSSSSNPLRTPDPAPANNPAQGQPRLRSDAGNIAGTNVLNRLDPASLGQVQIQTLCQGLAVCVPSGAGMLFHPDYRQQDSLCLQRVTDALLQRAMALGLPDALQANGEVLDILNWLSRALKVGLLMPSRRSTCALKSRWC